MGDLVEWCTERIEQSAQRHVLAERDAPDLVVATGDLAVRCDDDLGVGEPVGLPRDVLRDADGDRHAEAASLRSDGLELGATGEVGHVHDVLGPHDEVELVVGLDRASRLEVPLCHDRAGHVVGASALLTASLNGGDVEEHASPAAPRRHGAEHDDCAGGEQPSDGETPIDEHPAESSGQDPERAADLEHDPRQQHDAADTNDAGEWAGRLGDAQAGQRNAPEGPREPQCFGERVGARPADRAPPAVRRRRGSGGVERGEHGAGDDVAGGGQLPHPRHPHGHPGEGENEGEPRPLAPRRGIADGDLEHRNSDECQRPPPPRGQRQCDSETTGEGDERPPGCRQPAGVVDVVVVGRGGSTRASVAGSTRSRNTTIRSATEPGGWQANSVAEWR